MSKPHQGPPESDASIRRDASSGMPRAFDLTRTTVSEMNSSTVTWTAPTMKLTRGRSEVGSTAEGEYVCVLTNAGEEVARIPVRLGGTGVTIVRP